MTAPSRRGFLRSGAAMLAGSAALGSISGLGATAASAPASARGARARRDDELAVGVIGCGGRGTGAATDALRADPSVRIAALADAFPDRIERARTALAEHDASRATVDASRCFTGFDAATKLLALDLDVVILATPPGFRPGHFSAAVDAGRHVFLEKPAAVCPAGVRQVIDASRRADEKGLCVVAGTQRRHQKSYLEAMRRLRDGAIGRPVAARSFWNMGDLWVVAPDPARSDVENQLRNWLYHTWLSGDHIVEQHVHNIDVVNWAFDAHPIRACAVGGRQSRTDPKYGHVYDHFAVDFEYPDGRFALSMARQQKGTTERVEEIIHGADGMMRLSPGEAEVRGSRPWRYDGPNPSPFVAEHAALFDAIRGGTRVNESRTIAESTLSAIMGRIAAYTGQDLTWDQAMSHELDMRPPADLSFSSRPQDPVAIPGRAAKA
ncbi:MAG: Gfo/Idh/MocA family oxidoreductase [Phycisphaerae bacterium]|nr:Gfo/Idh/MocA family oxidoreductase [Phycisphaerae bacterium]